MPFTVGQYLTANDLKSQEDAHTLGYGVVNGLKVVPTDPASMDVQVETGKAYVADTLVEKGAVTDLTVGAADPTNPRKDIVVCNSAGTLSIVAGTPEAALPSDKVGVYTLNPEPESIPADSIILGEIWVPAGATEITGSEIYDKRVSIADFLTHKGDASAHHAKTTSLGDITDHNLAAHGLGAVVPHDALANLTAKAHGSLTGVTPNLHHPQAHTLGSHSTKAHGELSDAPPDAHHPQSHNAASHSDIASSGANIDDAVTKRHARSHDHSLAADGTPIAVAGVPNLAASKITSGRFPVDRLPAMTNNKIWKGTGGNVAEVDLPAAGAPTSNGTYTGDSSVSRAIPHGLGVIPKIVLITYDGTYWYRIVVDQARVMWAGNESTGGTELAVTAMDATNFYVGNATSYETSANKDGKVYGWVAIG